MNPNIWGDPEVFRPERFISNEGKLLKSDALIPFGSGKKNLFEFKL
jgi:cytochrome P450